ARRVEPGAKGHVELAARGHVDREPELGEQPFDGRDGGRLARVQHLEAFGARPERLEIRTGPRSDVVLRVDVERRPELRHDVDHVASSDDQVAELVDPAPHRVDRRALDYRPLAGGAHGPIIPAGPRPRRLWPRFGREPAGSAPGAGSPGPWAATVGEMARVIPPPSAAGVHAGRPYITWLPSSQPPWPGMVIIHGAGSRKENHGDFGRACAASGWAALAFDQRGHGDSEDGMSPAALADVSRMAGFLARVDGVDTSRVCVRGSSLGGFMAIQAAATSEAIAGAIAICPAGSEDLVRGL